MAFGPFKIKANLGETIIAGPTAANTFMRSLGPEHRHTYQWKVVERMLEVAWMSEDSENLAARAFKIALETDNFLIG